MLRLWGWLAEWVYHGHTLRVARRVLADDAALQVLACGSCPECHRLKMYRLHEGRRYW
jgi:hypothetical protein